LPTTGRLAVIVAGLAGALLALCAGAAPAFAAVLAPRGGDPHGRPGLPTHAHTPVTGGMPGWQTTLLVAGAVLLAAALAAAAYRIRSARQPVSTSTAN